MFSVPTEGDVTEQVLFGAGRATFKVNDFGRKVEQVTDFLPTEGFREMFTDPTDILEVAKATFPAVIDDFFNMSLEAVNGLKFPLVFIGHEALFHEAVVGW